MGTAHQTGKGVEMPAAALPWHRHALTPWPSLPISGEGENAIRMPQTCVLMVLYGYGDRERGKNAIRMPQTPKNERLLPFPRIGRGVGGEGRLRVIPQNGFHNANHNVAIFCHKPGVEYH